ncbi:hypothetical protein HDV00_007133 [Rhizophlyctis rosea]|nr:hypothetical protein HDV00_007133 [Rhizophlyctis rosea]
MTDPDREPEPTAEVLSTKPTTKRDEPAETSTVSPSAFPFQPGPSAPPKKTKKDDPPAASRTTEGGKKDKGKGSATDTTPVTKPKKNFEKFKNAKRLRKLQGRIFAIFLWT